MCINWKNGEEKKIGLSHLIIIWFVTHFFVVRRRVRSIQSFTFVTHVFLYSLHVFSICWIVWFCFVVNRSKKYVCAQFLFRLLRRRCRRLQIQSQMLLFCFSLSIWNGLDLRGKTVHKHTLWRHSSLILFRAKRIWNLSMLSLSRWIVWNFVFYWSSRSTNTYFKHAVCSIVECIFLLSMVH